MQKLTILIFSLFISFACDAQYLLGFHTENNDSFREWMVEVEIDSLTTVEGKLELTWGIGDDFTSWRYSIGDKDGEIDQKYGNNDGYWELKQDGEVVSITRTWPNDPSQWKVKYNGQKITIKTKFGNTLDEWENRNTKKGDLIIYTEREGDPRDWIIEDYMNDDIPFSMRMAATFIAIYSSSPKI